MQTLVLTFDETETFKKAGCVYCIRDSTVYLVERKKINEHEHRLEVTVINAPIKVLGTYSQQTAIGV